jgi:hypothetical protein
MTTINHTTIIASILIHSQSTISGISVSTSTQGLVFEAIYSMLVCFGGKIWGSLIRLAGCVGVCCRV